METTNKAPHSITESTAKEMEAASMQSNSEPSSFRGSWAKKLSVETGGIERVTPEQRQHNTTHVWNATTFWLSANMAIATLSTGMLGPIFGLSFYDSIAVIVVVNLFACMIPAWTATFGLTGLRMTTFSRYSFGYWGNLLVVVFSMISTTGWNALNAISGASCLAALSNGAMPAWVGVIVIATAVWIICVFGISWIHRIDSFIWIPPCIVWCVAAGTGAKHFDINALHSPTGVNGAASSLSFIAVTFSFAVSWVNCAADYNVRMPAHTPQHKIFIATFLGILVPAILVQSLGAALSAGMQANASWYDAYDTFGVGGPLAKALEPAGGFSKFLLALAGLSAIPNNIPNNYSFALHAQNFGPWAVRVPRIVFVTFGYIIAVIVGCLASLSFATSLQTFLSIIGSWTVIHIVVIAEEHLFFRKCRWSAYDFDIWNKPASLTFGWAAIGAFCFGFFGASMGLNVAWYSSPIARLIGSNGANLALELSFAFSALTFPFFRWLELRAWQK